MIIFCKVQHLTSHLHVINQKVHLLHHLTCQCIFLQHLVCPILILVHLCPILILVHLKTRFKPYAHLTSQYTHLTHHVIYLPHLPHLTCLFLTQTKQCTHLICQTIHLHHLFHLVLVPTQPLLIRFKQWAQLTLIPCSQGPKQEYSKRKFIQLHQVLVLLNPVVFKKLCQILYGRKL